MLLATAALALLLTNHQSQIQSPFLPFLDIFNAFPKSYTWDEKEYYLNRGGVPPWVDSYKVAAHRRSNPGLWKEDVELNSRQRLTSDQEIQEDIRAAYFLVNGRLTRQLSLLTGVRVEDISAMARSRPCLMKGRAPPRDALSSSTWLPRTAVVAGAPPLKGMWLAGMPASVLNRYSAARCEDVPTPAVA